MSVFQDILYEVKDSVAYLTLNRPTQLNAWTRVMEAEVYQAVTRADADESVRAIVIGGAGKAFCAGAEMQAMQTGSYHGDQAALLHPARNSRETESSKGRVGRFGYLLTTAKPVIAAMNGAAVGVGLVVALHCDLRFAREGAKISAAFPRRGLPAEQGISYLLPRMIGTAQTLDILLTGRVVEAAEAAAMGLINRAIPADRFSEEIQRTARELVTLSSPSAVRAIKRQVYAGLSQTYAQAVEMAEQEVAHCRQSADFREGIASFLEKRPPTFTGR